MGISLYQIQQGEPVVVSTGELVFLGTGSEGEPTAARRLVWPEALSPLLAPLVYEIDRSGIPFNPTRTLNFDRVPLPHPRSAAVETLGTTAVVRFERGIDDVVITEVWDAKAGASMPTAFFRLLYEYLVNSALIPAGGPYLVWEPRDVSEHRYEVALISLSAGGSDDESRFHVADLRADPRTAAKTLEDALTSLSPTPTGLVTTDVVLRFKILGEV